MSYRFSEQIRSTLTVLFKAWMSATGDDPTTTSRRFAQDGSFYARLSDNQPSVTKADAIIQRFSDDWPIESAWPASIARPPVGKWDDIRSRDARVAKNQDAA